jgi:prophage regulatory protein
MTTRLSAAVAEAIAEMRHTELENAVRAVIGDREYFNSTELERLTGTPSSTWRYWVSVGQGPESFLLVKRRVWPRTQLIRWLVAQEQASRPVDD